MLFFCSSIRIYHANCASGWILLSVDLSVAKNECFVIDTETYRYASTLMLFFFLHHRSSDVCSPSLSLIHARASSHTPTPWEDVWVFFNQKQNKNNTFSGLFWAAPPFTDFCLCTAQQHTWCARLLVSEPHLNTMSQHLTRTGRIWIWELKMASMTSPVQHISPFNEAVY